MNDSLVKGQYYSAKYLEQGNIDSNSLGNLYSSNFVEGKSAQDVGVHNTGIDDNSDVYYIDNENTMEINTLLQNAKDPLNSAISTMDVEHYEIHEGDHYFCSCVQAVAGSATIDYVLEIKAKPVHLVFSVFGNDAGISGGTYENVVANEDGTVLLPHNNNRLSSNVATLVERLNPTGVVITNALLFRSFRSGTGGNPSQRQSGSVERSREVILKPNTKYLIRTTNLSTSTNNISFDFSWYEL